jgi:hypothetical protein
MVTDSVAHVECRFRLACRYQFPLSVRLHSALSSPSIGESTDGSLAGRRVAWPYSSRGLVPSQSVHKFVELGVGSADLYYAL